jgi:hypothetical protein
VSRQVALILALGALAVAAVFVSIASWVLLWAERRERHPVEGPLDPEPAGKPGGAA